MSDVCQLLVLRLDTQRYALDLVKVERVIRALAVTPLPGAPASVLGALRLHGQLLPVFDIRQRFGLPNRLLRLSDQIVIAQAGQGQVGLCVDEVEQVAAFRAEQIVASEALLDGLDYVQGLIELPDGLLLIHDLDRFLSSAELRQLDTALAQAS